MKLKSKIEKNFFFVLFFLIILLLHKVDFFKSFSKIIYYDYDTRLTKAYAYCSDEGVGYLRFLKKEFDFKSNPKIIVQSHTPGLDWVLYNSKKVENADEIIILNHQGKFFSRTLELISSNKFYDNNRVYNAKRIIGVEISGNFKDVLNNEMIIEVSSRVKLAGSKKFEEYKSKKLSKKITENKKIYFPINMEFIGDNYAKSFKINILTSNDANKNITGARLLFENNLDLDDYNIVHSYNNCYYLKK